MLMPRAYGPKSPANRRGFVRLGTLVTACLLAVAGCEGGTGQTNGGGAKGQSRTRAVERSLPTGIRRESDGRIVSSRDGAELVIIDGGDFTMGTQRAQDSPMVHATVRDFLLDRTEVTNSQFAQFVESSSYVSEAEKSGKSKALVGGKWVRISGADWKHPYGPTSTIDGKGSFPVVHVSWNDASAYAKWAGRRLPSEAEFEWAVRGGTEGLDFPWGNSESPPTGAGNFADVTFGKKYPDIGTGVPGYDDTIPELARVGMFPPNRWGVFDIIGNAREWCEDKFFEGPQAPRAAGKGDRIARAAGLRPGRVVRGGAFCFQVQSLQCGIREWEEPQETLGYQGFRCAADLR